LSLFSPIKEVPSFALIGEVAELGTEGETFAVQAAEDVTQIRLPHATPVYINTGILKRRIAARGKSNPDLENYILEVPCRPQASRQTSARLAVPLQAYTDAVPEIPSRNWQRLPGCAFAVY
jgi:hypothetical protein